MIHGLKPVNSAEMRQYLDILRENHLGQEPVIDADLDQIGQEPMTDPDSQIHEEFPGTHGDWMHGGFRVRYNPESRVVTVRNHHQERSYKFTSEPTDRSYRQAVQQLIDRLEDEAELHESPSLVMRDWITICR